MKLSQLIPVFLIATGMAVAQSPAALTSDDATPAPPAKAGSFDLTAIDPGFTQIDQGLLAGWIDIDDLLVLVLIVKHGAVHLQPVGQPAGLEAGLDGIECFGLDRGEVRIREQELSVEGR